MAHSARGPLSSESINVWKDKGDKFPASRRALLVSGTGARVLPLLRSLQPHFLAGLDPSELEEVLAAARHLRWEANKVVTDQDGHADNLYLLLTGRARYFCVTRKGQKIILLWIPPGEIFGGAALMTTGAKYIVSTETVRPSTMLVWERRAIRDLAANCPRLMQNAFSLTFRYLVAYRAAHISLLSDNARERLANVLSSLAVGIGRRVEDGVELNIRNEELANEANVTPFTTSRLLSEWQRAGVLVKKRGKILLRSPEHLHRPPRA